MKNSLKSFSKFILLFSFLALFPLVTFAQDFIGPCPSGTRYTTSGCVPASGIAGLLYNIQQILNSIIPILILLGIVYFVWGVVRFVIADAEEAKTKGKDQIIYGLIGFAVIFGIWGLVNIVIDTFNLGGQTPTLEPFVSTNTNCSLAGNPTFQDLLCYITKIINDAVIPLIFAVAVAMFVWGVVNFFIINADEEGKRAQGRQFMIWGIVALAVMLSIWGLVGILGQTFGINGSVLPKVTPPGQQSLLHILGGGIIKGYY